MAGNETQERVWKARDVVQNLVKALKAAGQFTREHQHFHRAIDALRVSLQDFLDRYGALRIRPQPAGLTLEGQETFSWEKGLPFRMYMDGIREFAILPGVTEEELSGFIEIAESDPTQAETDFVRLMWQKNFSHITHFALDELYSDFMGEGSEDLAADPDVKRQRESLQSVVDEFLERERGYGGVFEVSETGDELKAAPAAAAAPAMPKARMPEFSGPLAIAALSAEETAAVAADVATIGPSDLIPRTMDVLAGYLAIETDPSAVDPVERLGTALIDATLVQGDLQTLNLLLDRVIELERAGGAAAAFARRTKEFLASPTGVLRVLAALTKGFVGGVSEITRYFRRLPPESLSPLCNSYGILSARDLRRAVREVLGERAREDLDALKGLLTAEDASVVRDGLQILGSVGGREAAARAESVFSRPEEDLREHALHVLRSASASVRAPSAARLLRDASPRIAAAAARLLSAGPPAVAGRALLDWVRRPEFSALPIETKKAGFEALRITGGSLGEEWLRQQAEARGLFRSRADKELSRLASEVLESELRVPEAPPEEEEEGAAAPADLARAPASVSAFPRPAAPAPARPAAPVPARFTPARAAKSSAAAAAERRGFHGEIESVPVSEILQLLGNSRRTGCLEVLRPDGAGRIFLKDGAPVHATAPDKIGNEAVFDILDWTTGEFIFVGERESVERSIQEHLQGLLLEVARRKDETQRKKS